MLHLDYTCNIVALKSTLYFMESNVILNKHKLKRTSCREGIIDVIINANEALSDTEIRDRLTENYDRTTFYRSFKTLEEHKILHKIVVDNQLTKYELDNSVTRKKEHAHFFCNTCEIVLCLDTIEIPQPILPKGCTANEIELIVKGKCNHCAQKN
ncbi:Fur family transcriptional regulator [Saccharicrinis aurantiacus]|uniref:Fur family transcriptional regulator n=1 Tax=Saccharicrinis aurantiacus TaxID=1849719 RepID=UPI0024905A75|nr:transcriptional repressor [Saccharicrinis aurantiacus]